MVSAAADTGMILHIAKMTGVAGTENHLLTLLPALRQAGVDPHLVILVEPDKPMDAYVEEMTGRGVPTIQRVIQKDVDFPLIRDLTALIRDIQPSAVHTHLIHADWHGVIAARRAKVKRIYWSGHNDDPFRRRLAIRLIQAYLWQRVTAGIAISEAVRQFMVKVEFAPPRKTHTIHYGFDPTDESPRIRGIFRRELGIPPEAFVFGSVCRLIEQKGLDHAVTAFGSLVGENPLAHYVIIGDGILRDELQTQIDTLGLRERVHLAGWRANAAALMPAFDAFVMPSRWEGFGLVLLEAMAARLPILASRVSDLPEIVAPGETGYLVPPGDFQVIRTGMLALLRDPEAARLMGEAGRQRLEAHFSVAEMVEKTLKVYNLAP